MVSLTFLFLTHRTCTSLYENNSNGQVWKDHQELFSVITQIITAMLSQTTQLYAWASSLSRKCVSTDNIKGTVYQRGPINGIIHQVSTNKRKKQ